MAGKGMMLAVDLLAEGGQRAGADHGEEGRALVFKQQLSSGGWLAAEGWKQHTHLLAAVVFA